MACPLVVGDISKRTSSLHITARWCGASSKQHGWQKDEMSANIILHRATDAFARVSKKLLNDPALSFKAKGVLAYLIGKPENWKLRVSDLENHCNEGKASIR